MLDKEKKGGRKKEKTIFMISFSRKKKKLFQKQFQKKERKEEAFFHFTVEIIPFFAKFQ
jgi:hypothetical protein